MLASISESVGSLAVKCAAASAALAARSSTWIHASARVTGLAAAVEASTFSNGATVCRDCLPMASTRIANVSLRPSSHRWLRIGASQRAVRPGRNVSRWPARLPLSTVET